jgi:hypothetical protein
VMKLQQDKVKNLLDNCAAETISYWDTNKGTV